MKQETFRLTDRTAKKAGFVGWRHRAITVAAKVSLHGPYSMAIRDQRAPLLKGQDDRTAVKRNQKRVAAKAQGA